MNHPIMGVLPNEDFASFEQALPLSTQDLMDIMGLCFVEAAKFTQVADLSQ